MWRGNTGNKLDSQVFGSFVMKHVPLLQYTCFLVLLAPAYITARHHSATTKRGRPKKKDEISETLLQ
ncbi:hypothetical protein Y1Q_0012556 [Alligator mississippiensis]|uniref:Uncharacterized protein n=1 Tax=Alligator mississippiensis TaxID=8496 RepID=A0A151M817_ALLMI|nr:hypothetical protein Y1Q_0012556 [Alligator mississippiensis]